MTDINYFKEPLDVICRDALAGVPEAMECFDSIVFSSIINRADVALYAMEVETNRLAVNGQQMPKPIIYSLIRVVFDPEMTETRPSALWCLVNSRSTAALDALRVTLCLPHSETLKNIVQGAIRQIEIRLGGGQ